MTMIGSRLVLPRYGTARNWDRETLGHEVALVGEKLGTPLMPWQRLVADVVNEVDPETGDLWYSEVNLFVPRQSGKTTMTVVKNVHRCTMVARRLGRQRITYTAQDRQMARRKLERDFAPILRASPAFKEILPASRNRPTKPTEWKLSLNNGQEHILFGSGSYWQIDTPSASAGHGDTLDQGDIDEAFDHQNDDVEQAMRPAQATRKDAQLWVLSTVGTEDSSYLYTKMMAGRAAAKAGDSGRVAYFEWSLPGGPSEPDVPQVDIDDEDVWWEYMPALGHTVSAHFIRTELERARRDPEKGEAFWLRAYGNQWVKVPTAGTGAGVWPAEVWRAIVSDEAVPSGPIAIGVDANWDRTAGSIALAGGGVVELAVDPQRRRLPLVFGDLASDVVRIARKTGGVVAVDPSGPAGFILPDLEAAGVSVLKVSGQAMGQACGALFTAVNEQKLAVRRNADLDAAVAGARTKPMSNAWVWARKDGTVDVSPLVAVTLAWWAASQAGPAAPKVFAY